jgi:glycosyltransferase involved in cell wall biosynthesis
VYFGRVSPEKGLATLVRAAAAARCKISIVGTGPQLEELRRLAADLGADVTFAGYLTGEALHEVVRTARAVVLPSEWYENAPLSVLEAFALGKPVIAAAIGGLPELVIDGESGWHFQSGSREGLAERLRQVNSSPDDAIRAFGSEALQRVRVNYSPDRYMNDIRKLYGRLGVLWN